MKEWITGGLFLFAVLAVGYRFALPVAGSLYRSARTAYVRRLLVRRIARACDVPAKLVKTQGNHYAAWLK